MKWIFFCITLSWNLQAETPIELKNISGKSGAEIFKVVCSQCHGEQGEGKMELKSPSIAGMPKWYALSQLKKFKQGVRGATKEDPSGFMMHNVAKQIDEAAFEKVASYIVQLEPIEMENTLKGDALKGEVIFKNHCMACHRYNASGEIVFGSPPLLHLQDWYLRNQLQKFRSKLRGTHPADIKGAKMVDVMNVLPDSDAVEDILAYISTLKNKAKKK